MLKKCGVDRCKAIAEICCECKTNNYYCVEHIVNHIKKVGHHMIYSNFIELKPEVSANLLKELAQKCKQILHTKHEMEKLCLEIITFVNSKCRAATKRLKDELKSYRTIHKLIAERNEVEREVYEKFTTIGTSTYLIPKEFNALKEQIHSFFQNHFKVINLKKEDKDYFWVNQDSFVKIDLDLLKKSQFKVKHSQEHVNSCKLPDGTFFVNSVGAVDCYIADLDKCTLTPIEKPSPVTTYYGVISCLDNSVYMINGYSSPMNEKYDLITKTWEKVSACPLTSHVNTGGIILDKICLTSYNQNNAFVYDPKTDSYTSILSLSKGYKLVSHGFILTSQNVYRLEDNNILTWKPFQYRAKDNDCCYCMMNTYVFKRGKYLYFCNCSQKLYRFDMKLFEYKLVSYN